MQSFNSIQLKCEYVIPEFNDINQTYFPFIRNDHWDVFEIVKTIIIIPIAILRAIISLYVTILGWILCKIAIIGCNDIDSYNSKTLTTKIPFWCKILRRTIRYLSCILLLSLGVHSYSFKKLTYKDLYRLYGYKRPDIQYNDPTYNIEPKSYVIVSNHLGYLDIILYSAHYNGSFLSSHYIRFVPFIGDIACFFQCLFIKKGLKTSQLLSQRVELTHNTHDIDIECDGCYLCSSSLIIFPESTTTNSNKCLLAFRSSIFRIGRPLRPVVIKTHYKHFNYCWESIPFIQHLFKTYTQFYNDMEVIEAPPYIPNKKEIEDPYLYSFNVNKLICKMLGDEYKVYLLNRHHKKKCYHRYLLKKCNETQALLNGKMLFQNDVLIQRYLQFIENEQIL